MTSQFNPEKHPHVRRNVLTGELVLVSPHRTQRPWQGQRESNAADQRPAHDPKCYLCPGNVRANGAANPQYKETFVFDNDYAALLPEVASANGGSSFFEQIPVQGECKVICFSPRHDLTLPEMGVNEIESVVRVWASESAELGKRYQWVQVFENKGAVMGCSNPHPHGQIWAGTWIPTLVQREEQQQKAYLQTHSRSLLLDYLDQELAQKERLVEVNDDWVLLVPFWAVWPYELLLAPRRRAIARLPDLTSSEQASLADILKRGLTRYDNLFETSFPYSMGWHGAPFDGTKGDHWQLHAHFYPPLLRSATVKKFMVGYEMLAEAQRDLTPELAAQRLRDVSTTHFKLKTRG